MSFKLCDSFSHYVTADIPDKWSAWNANGSGSVILPTGGRRSAGAYHTSNGNGNITYSAVFANNTSIVGFAFKADTLGVNGIHSVGDANGTHVVFKVRSDGSIEAQKMTFNSGPLQTDSFFVSLGSTDPGVITVGIWYYLEFKTIVDGSAGGVEIRVNTIPRLVVSGVDTVNSTYSSALTRTVFGTDISGGGTFCDLYILDSGGSAPHNDFYGDIRIDCHYPTADGTNVDGTPSSGSLRYAMVDETAPNDDVDYNSLTAPGKDSFVMANLIPTGATILSFQSVIAAKKTDAGGAIFKSLLRPVATDYDGSVSHTPSNDWYRFFLQPYENNPATGVQITEAEFNAMQAGYHRTA